MTAAALDMMRAAGYRCGVTIDAKSGTIERGTLEQTVATLAGWILERGTLMAQWTVEAGSAPAFLRDPWLAGYLEVEAKVAVFCQRKVDAIKIEAGLRRALFKH